MLITATITTGLMAGLFFAWSFSVTNGLANVSDNSFIEAFQAMNKAIQNPVFLVVFLGSALTLPWSLYLHWHVVSPKFWFILAATALYLSGSIATTFLGNIPLNEALQAFDLSRASVEEMALQREAFEDRWIFLHSFRTGSSLLAFVLLVISCTYSSG